MFKEIKNRDAWSTIRGFVYQVDITILRWLDLKKNEVLELEKGEDIDVVTLELSKIEKSRDLEQIKYREDNLSLNQVDVINLLFNFFIHKKNNPSCKLLYRFITNTNYVVERPSLFLDGKSGIETWIELSKDNSLKLDDSRLNIIKNHLIKKIDKLISDTDKEKNEWKDFKKHVSNKSNLIQFIKDFEWSFKNDNIDNIANKVKLQISKNFKVENPNTSELIYSRLFLFVFKLLCDKTLKKLDTNLLISQIELPELDAIDYKTLEILNNLLYDLDGRITILEKEVSLNTSKIAELIGNPELIANANTVFEYRTKNLSIESPPLINNGSLREKKVDEILNNFKTYSWIGFQGINGSGKTQLALLTLKKYTNYYWLDLRAYNQDIEKVTSLFETFLSIISNEKISHFRDTWVEKIISSFQNDTLIVLNDIPKVETGTSFGDLIILFVNKIENSKVKLLTTSNYKVRSDIESTITTNSFKGFSDFEFSDEEIKEYLINLNANDYVFNSVNLIASFSKRNPRLLSAIIYHLKSINWGENSVDIFDALLKKDFSENILNDSQALVKKFITNEDSKELLYRLSLINWDFDFKTVKLISEIPIKILYPYDRIQDLINLWIQESNNKLFNISPLIFEIGDKNLSDDIIQNIHIAIANSIIKNEVINEINASRCITSFLKGKDFNNAGLLLINIYNSATTPTEVKHLMSWGYFGFWSELRIPQEMDIILRSNIRIQQIRLHKIIDKDFSIQRNILEGYLNETGISASEKVLIHLQCLSLVLNERLSKFWFHIDAIINNISELDIRYKSVIDVELLYGMLWTPISQFNKWSDIEKWLKTITLIEEKFELNFFDNDISQSAITIISNKIIKIENLKKEKDRDWLQVLYNLNILNDYFIKRNEEILEAVVLKEIISLECQINNDYNKAEKITNENAEKYILNEAKYLLYESFGKLQYKNNNINSSNYYLAKSLELNCIEQPSYIDTLVYAGTSISKFNTCKSVEYFLDALKLAKLNEYSELDFIQIHGELAIAFWLNNDFINSFKYFELFVNRLFQAKKEHFGEFWIRLFSWSGHSLGYISVAVGKEKTPTQILGGADYVKPYQGILTFNTKNLSDLYEQKKEPLIMAHMAIFADGVNELEKAYKWSLKAFDLARKSESNDVLQMISSVCSQYSLVNFKVEEALESYLLFSSINSHLTGTSNSRFDNLNKVNIKDLIKVKPSEQWNIAESLSVTFAIIPLFIKLLNFYLYDDINKLEKYNNLRRGIENYKNQSSDDILWNQVLSITKSIMENNTLETSLINKANQYSNNSDSKNLQIICLLGVIFKSKNNVINQIFNVFPYLTKIYKSHNSIRKNVLLPFIIERSIFTLKNEYIGNSEELSEIINMITSINSLDINSIQLTLQIVFNELDISLSDDRKDWLFNYKEID